MFRAVSMQSHSSVFPLSWSASPLTSVQAANTLASHFYISCFLGHSLAEPESTFLHYQLFGDNTLKHNCSLSRLRSVLPRLPSCSSPGSDILQNIFFTNLPNVHHHALLNILYYYFGTTDIPSTWRLSLVVPTIKPGKDPATVSAHRPISKFACVGKIRKGLLLIAWCGS